MTGPTTVKLSTSLPMDNFGDVDKSDLQQLKTALMYPWDGIQHDALI